ncbi:MAG: MMPL family transporter [Actinobacteria bacterium]|nr:MMPL family transporter [Actinomycetota bacterium]
MIRAIAWVTVRLSIVLVPAWIVAAIAAVHFLPTIARSSNTPLGGLVPTGAPAVTAERREAARFGSSLLTRVAVVQHADGGLTRSQLGRTASAALAIDRRHARPPIAFAAPIVSNDRSTTVSYLYFRPSVSESRQLEAAQSYARALDPPGLRGGALLARNSEFDQIQQALPVVTIATVALIVLILLLTFRAPMAPLVGLGAAAIAYVISVHVLAWVGQQRHTQVPKEVEPILIALLLGLVTDYTLFFLASMKTHLQAGESRFRAAEAATIENLPIILTAGLIVALGSLTLVVGRLAIFRSFGPGMALTVLVAIAVALTFVPAVMGLLGAALFWPSMDRRPREPRRRLWQFITARPVAAMLAAIVACGLLALSFGLTQTRLGFTLIRGLPTHSETKKAQGLAERGFARGVIAPTEVLVEAQGLGTHRAALARLQREIASTRGIARVVGPGDQPSGSLPVFVSRPGDAARYAVVIDQEALDAKAIDVLRRLQDRMPALLRNAGLVGAHVSYAGDTALAQDTVHAIRRDGVRVGLAVLLVNLILLALFLRAVWAPLYLLAASTLALAASLGATTWIMQRLLGHDDLTYYVPFAAGVLLISLGSDYNVFVVGRIWQSARERPMREAIAAEAPRASATITTAGLTLAGSFGLLALVPVRPMRELALAMAIGILLDTFVVRSILVPALLALFRHDAPALLATEKPAAIRSQA